jgi:asparagine synthase (glutamine-hydrolysing)
MKQALGRFLPDELLHRRKMGFVTPISAWFRGPLAAEAAAVAASPAFAELGWFDTAALARLAADHRAGRAEHGRTLWQLLMLERSLQRVFGFGGAASSGYTAAAK